MVCFLPKALLITSIEAVLMAGPAIRSTKAAPGVIPFIISESAIGMEPVAHVYIGIAIASTISIFKNG